MIDAIMDDSTDKSIDVFKTYINRIENYEIDVNELVVSSMLAANYKSDNLPHVNLAKKLRQRNDDVQVGDRIPYIFIETDDPKKKKYELAEDPTYAKTNGLRYNRLCYLEQLAKPILSLLKIVLIEDPNKMDNIINFVNNKIVVFGGKKLRPSDFKMDE